MGKNPIKYKKINRIDYIKKISGDEGYDGSKEADEILKKDEQIKEALKQALEIRKFEIELYWKRAQYFWTFLVTIYGSYFLAYSKVDSPNDIQKPLILLGLATLGMFFSLSWHLVNRGSKFWQQNWEYHVDELEKYVYGPLYKTVIAKTNYGFSPVSAHPFSVSNINCLLSGTVLIASYILLFAESYKLINGFNLPNNVFNVQTSNLIFTVWFLLLSAITFGFVTFSKGRIAKDYNDNKNESKQPVFLLRDDD